MAIESHLIGAGSAMTAQTRARSHRLLPFVVGLLVIAGAELAIHLFGNDGLYNTDFFDFSPVQRDVLQKHVIYDKFVRMLRDVPSDAVQVGDSSGFYGVIPAQVSAAAPNVSYLNMSCCGDSGWSGYFYQAELAFRRRDKPKFLVLHVTPYWAPAAARFYGDNQLAVLVRDDLVKDDWWHWFRAPSAGYRLRLTNLIYHGEWLDDFPYDNHEWPTVGYPSIRAWREQFKEQRGWVPMPVDLNDPFVKNSPPVACDFDDTFSETRYLGLFHVDTLYRYLERFALLARAYGARFAFVTNPVPCAVQNDAVSTDIERQMQRFKTDYPDAIVPFEYLRQWPQSAFRDRYHLNPEGGARHSRLIGEALRAATAGQTKAAMATF
jgi:hypothetical protein